MMELGSCIYSQSHCVITVKGLVSYFFQTGNVDAIQHMDFVYSRHWKLTNAEQRLLSPSSLPPLSNILDILLLDLITK